jgi:hypothetical protein
VHRGHLVVHRVDDQPERDLALVLGAAPGEDEHPARASGGGGVVEQRALAEAGLPDDGDHPHLAVRRTGDRALEHLDLVRATVEGHRRGA